MARHKPAQEQTNLFQDRSRLIRLLRNLTCVQTPTQKLMLMVLDAYIGRYPSIRLAIETLAEKTLVSPKSAYRIKDELAELGLLVARPIGGRTFEFALGWARMAALEDECMEGDSGADQPREDDVAETSARLTHETDRLTGENSRLMGETGILIHETTRLTHEKSFLMGKTDFLMGKTHIRNIDLTSNCASISSSSSSTDGADREAVVVMVQSCGVSEAESTADAALAAGMSVEQIAAVIAHYRSQPGRWPEGVLVHRLTKPGAHRDAPEQGWFGDTAEWKAAQKRLHESQAARPPVARGNAVPELEQQLGAQLDALTEAELTALVADWTPRQRRDVAFHGRQHKDLRPLLLTALQQRQSHPETLP